MAFFCHDCFGGTAKLSVGISRPSDPTHRCRKLMRWTGLGEITFSPGFYFEYGICSFSKQLLVASVSNGDSMRLEMILANQQFECSNRFPHLHVFHWRPSEHQELGRKSGVPNYGQSVDRAIQPLGGSSL